MTKNTIYWKSILGIISISLLIACTGNSHDGLKTNALTMGLYKGSPTSVVEVNGELKGIGYELGKNFALEKRFEYVPTIFPKNADVLAAVKAGQVDLVFTNASSDRAAYIHFTKTVLKIEKGYLIGPHSKIKSASDINQNGIKIAYTVGSSSYRELLEIIPKARLVEVKSINEASELLKAGEIDGFSTNKAILFEMADNLKGSKVLPVVIGYELMALGVPLNQVDRVPDLNVFVEKMTATGKLKEIIQRSGSRGIVLN